MVIASLLVFPWFPSVRAWQKPDILCALNCAVCSLGPSQESCCSDSPVVIPDNLDHHDYLRTAYKFALHGNTSTHVRSDDNYNTPLAPAMYLISLSMVINFFCCSKSYVFSPPISTWSSVYLYLALQCTSKIPSEVFIFIVNLLVLGFHHRNLSISLSP